MLTHCELLGEVYKKFGVFAFSGMNVRYGVPVKIAMEYPSANTAEDLQDKSSYGEVYGNAYICNNKIE